MSDFIRHDRTSLPYCTSVVHAIGLVAVTYTGFILLASRNVGWASLGGLWMLVPHLFGVFHGWSFPDCRPASRALFLAAVPMTAMSLLVAFIAEIDAGLLFIRNPFVLPRQPTAAMALVMFVPILQHFLEHAAFAMARRIANASAIPGRLIDDDLDISL